MIEALLQAPAVHIGGGSLGRGLVVPVLVANGASVVIVDSDAVLIDQLAREHGYTLRIGTTDARIDIAAALHVGDPALPEILRQARLVTTSVRQPNLERVAGLLARCWNDRAPIARVVVGCENLQHVGIEMHQLLTRAGADMRQVATPDCVVDRVCAARWPADLTVETENYLEWSVEGDTLAGIRQAEAVEDVGPRFARKRYLVNTYADAMAVLGERSGYTMLYQAAADDDLLQRIEPLMAALRLLLRRRDGFDATSLRAYQDTARRRLANAAIDRKLSTVARDLRRKMSPQERFMEPVTALIAAGEDAGPAIGVIADILDDPAESRAATLAMMQADWHGESWAPAVLRLIGQRWQIEP